MTFTQLQGIVREMIVANAWFAEVAEQVLVESRGDFEVEMQKQLDRMGLSIVIATPESSSKGDAPLPHVEAVVVVAVAEMPMINESGKTAAEALDRLVSLLHHQRIGGPGSPRIRFTGHDSEDIAGMAAYRVKFAVGITHQFNLTA